MVLNWASKGLRETRKIFCLKGLKDPDPPVRSLDSIRAGSYPIVYGFCAV